MRLTFSAFLRSKTGKKMLSAISFASLAAAVFLTGYLLVIMSEGGSLTESRLAQASGGTATTTVTILNVAPTWAVDAEEIQGSSTSSPTYAGANVSWSGTGSSPNGNNLYLLICKTSSTPTAHSGSAPTCGAGGQWAVSGAVATDAQATTTYTTTSTDPQVNPWFAWTCDSDAVFPLCSTTYTQGTSTTASPFIVNHWPSFTALTNDGPKDPGAVITWTAVASDTDNFTGATDTVALFVCRANDFTWSSTTASCGGGGTYCSSTTSIANPSCGYTNSSTLPDKAYDAYGFVTDNHNFAAVGGAEATDSQEVVNDVAPSVNPSSIQLTGVSTSTTNLTLTNAGGQTTGFHVLFTVTDRNGCQTASGTAEDVSSVINVYRSGVGSSSCQVAGDYNTNSCYPAAIGTTAWNYSCAETTSTCSGTSDATADWSCTFPLWYNADPTDGTQASDTTYFSQWWLASVKVTDDNGATSSLSEESATSSEVQSFLSANLLTNAISYGGLTPGSSTDPLPTSTTLAANGNVGLDETLYGDSMCPTYSGAGSCPSSVTSTLDVTDQRYASSGVAFASGVQLALNPGNLFALHVFKTTATSTQATGTTFWGITVPGTITKSGGYTGQNTFIGVKSPAQYWQ